MLGTSGAGNVGAGMANAGGAASAGASGMNANGGESTSAGSSGHANGGSAGANGGHTNGGNANSAGAAGVAGDASAGTAGGGGAGGLSATVGTIVPLYTDPSDPSWAAIIAAKKAHPAVGVLAIVNPDSGPGAQVAAAYTAGIAQLVSAGVVPIGYVSTSYTARGEAYVKTNIDSWLAFYPKLSGIFFDEQSNEVGDEGFYQDVAQYAKQQGLSFTVGNPGTSVPASYLDTVDVMLIYEAHALPTLSSLTGYAAQRGHYGIIPYGAAFDAGFVSSAKADVQYVYATSDDLPNPWDSLTPYFDSLLAALSP